MANPNWVKGVSGNPKGKPVGTLNDETISKLERRAIFNSKVEKRWIKIIDALMEKELKYVAEEFMGKTKDEIDVFIKKEPTERIKAIKAMLKNADRPK
jgi:hypothetical protein